MAADQYNILIRAEPTAPILIVFFLQDMIFWEKPTRSIFSSKIATFVLFFISFESYNPLILRQTKVLLNFVNITVVEEIDWKPPVGKVQQK